MPNNSSGRGCSQLSVVAWLLAALLSPMPLSFAASTADPKLPAVSPGWKVEIVAEPPVLVHPSTVCVAPDGRVFVGQDPIDMGLPSNAAADSILCIHPDGKVTTFAEGLHAIYGLAYLDGKLYVHHTPKFSVFTDDRGIGKDRVDLFTTNPRPSLDGNGFNDHIPSNMRLGMDGWFYMSTGDKGIFGAAGLDGSKVNLEGGGIMRFRPDATHLEIYATGTRNHLDVAINAEDEIFTYDNTDDGHGWWTRVTHMVDGGFYGYPYDYKPRRPYTLWMMTDYGGGSPTGGLVYNEDALPEEYRGNLFLSEWGRRQLLRLKVVRDGATYRIESRVQNTGKDFLTAGSAEFRPNGLAFAPDGMSLYIADWNYGGWKAKVTAGRLLKLSYTGTSLATPKPAWWQAAAMNQPFEATTTELIEALKHPAQTVRLTAQRRLAERRAAAVPQLRGLLLDAQAPAHARWHAVWTLDAIDGGTSARQEIIEVASRDRDVSVRAQAIRQLGMPAAKDAVPSLCSSLKDANAMIRFRAATALGRIGDASAVPRLLEGLDDTDLFTRYSIFTALNRIGRTDSRAWKAIAAGLENSRPAIREGTTFAMRETFDEENVKALAACVSSAKPVEARVAALGVLVDLHRDRRPWRGEWWATQPVKGSPRPKNVDWSGTSLVLATVRNALDDSELAVRRAAIKGIATTRDPVAATSLRAMFGDPANLEILPEIIRSLGQLKDQSTGPLLAPLLENPKQHRDVLPDAIAAAGLIAEKTSIEALIQLTNPTNGLEVTTLALVVDALGTSKSPEAAPVVAKLLGHPDSQVRTRSSEALASIGGPAAFNATAPLLDDSALTVRIAAIRTAGLIRNKQALPKLLALYEKDDTRSEALLALTKMPDAQALEVYLNGLAAPNNATRDAARNAIEAFRDRALSQIESRHQEKPFTGQPLRELQRIYARNDRARKGPLFEGDSKPDAPEQYAKYAERQRGNPNRGQQLFQGQAGCAVCHRVKGQGGDVGPDLMGIATKYNRASLIDSVLYPSKQILDGYHSIVITLKDGESFTGFIRDEKADELTVVDSAAQKHVVKKDQIAGRQESKLSLMPDGLQAALTLTDFADLMAYLESLRQ